MKHPCLSFTCVLHRTRSWAYIHVTAPQIARNRFPIGAASGKGGHPRAAASVQPRDIPGVRARSYPTGARGDGEGVAPGLFVAGVDRCHVFCPRRHECNVFRAHLNLPRQRNALRVHHAILKSAWYKTRPRSYSGTVSLLLAEEHAMRQIGPSEIDKVFLGGNQDATAASTFRSSSTTANHSARSRLSPALVLLDEM